MMMKTMMMIMIIIIIIVIIQGTREKRHIGHCTHILQKVRM